MKATLVEHVNLSQDPIFIVGYPRSGTTLLQAMLATQKGVYSLPETHFFNVVYKVIKTDEQGYIESSCLNEVFKKIQEKMNLKFSQPEVKYIVLKAKEKRLNAKTLFELIVFQYLKKEIEEANINLHRWIEKTPNHVYFLDRISACYPEAQFINIIRNPISAIYSRKNHFPYNKETPIDMLARLWVKSINSVESFSKKYPNRVYSLRYEDLVENAEKELTEVCKFLNIDIRLNRISKYNEVSYNFIHPWETWKNNVKLKNISNTNYIYKKDTALFDVLKMQNILQEKMREYGYKISNQILQKIFDLWIK
jgi:hypothetical protein